MGIQTKTHVSPIFDGWIYRLTIQVCTTANSLSVCFYSVLFLSNVRCPQVLRWSINGFILPGQADNWLGISTQLANDICYWFGYIWLHLVICEAQNNLNKCHWAICLFYHDTLWLPTTLIGVLVILPCKSWYTESCPLSTFNSYR